MKSERGIAGLCLVWITTIKGREINCIDGLPEEAGAKVVMTIPAYNIKRTTKILGVY